MYRPTSDPYCYPGTTVLKNRPGLRRQKDLDSFEAVMVDQRLQEGLPRGRFGVSHYLAMHRHLFGDVYAWAGRVRTTRISKGTSSFCYPENIDASLRLLFAQLRRDNLLRGLSTAEFARRAAHVLAELNAVHAFREGNGRTQFSFTLALAAHAGHMVAPERIEPARFLRAMILSFGGNERPLVTQIAQMLSPQARDQSRRDE